MSVLKINKTLTDYTQSPFNPFQQTFSRATMRCEKSTMIGAQRTGERCDVFHMFPVLRALGYFVHPLNKDIPTQLNLPSYTTTMSNRIISTMYVLHCSTHSK